MSYAPQTLLDLRDYLQAETGLSDNELGIVGDPNHTYGYHLGEDRLPQDDYSARTKRDLAGLTDGASANDIGSFDRLVELTVHLVGEAQSGRTPDIRELIGPAPDGRAYRWDSLSGWRPQQRSEGDPHEWHLHVSWYRDSEYRDKREPFRRFFDTPTARSQTVLLIKTATDDAVYVSDTVTYRHLISPEALESAMVAGHPLVVVADVAQLEDLAGKPQSDSGGAGLTETQIRKIVREELDATKLAGATPE